MIAEPEQQGLGQPDERSAEPRVRVRKGRIPFWLKALSTAFAGLLVAFYWRHYGPANFLWFSDIALLLTVIALWFESRLLASTQAVSVLLLELVWNVDFLVRLLTGRQMVGLSAYMFDPAVPLFIRGLSLFHVPLPLLLLWLLRRLGYDRRAWLAQSVLAWLVLPICYWFTDPAQNINWSSASATPPSRRCRRGSTWPC